MSLHDKVMEVLVHTMTKTKMVVELAFSNEDWNKMVQKESDSETTVLLKLGSKIEWLLEDAAIAEDVTVSMPYVDNE